MIGMRNEGYSPLLHAVPALEQWYWDEDDNGLASVTDLDL